MTNYESIEFGVLTREMTGLAQQQRGHLHKVKHFSFRMLEL